MESGWVQSDKPTARVLLMFLVFFVPFLICNGEVSAGETMAAEGKGKVTAVKERYGHGRIQKNETEGKGSGLAIAASGPKKRHLLDGTGSAVLVKNLIWGKIGSIRKSVPPFTKQAKQGLDFVYQSYKSSRLLFFDTNDGAMGHASTAMGNDERVMATSTEPYALFLIGSGLLGFAIVVRRRDRRQET